MRTPGIARAFFGLTSLLITFGLVLQLALSLTSPIGVGSFDSTADRLVNFLSFFTVLSNIAVAATTGMLAVRLDRHRTAFWVLRLDGVVAIAVTGVVFHIALADLQELTGWSVLSDGILHTASPILAVLGWLVLGPRGRVAPRTALLAVIAPLGWLAYTFARGALVTDRNGKPYYPYPFLDAAEHGYPAALASAAIVAVLFLAICFGAVALDRHLPGVRLPELSEPGRAIAP